MEKDLSALHIKFSTPGSAEFSVVEEGLVTPAQMFALAGWLKWKAEMMFSIDMARKQAIEESKHIAIPNPGAMPLKVG